MTAYFITAPPPDSLESVWIPGGRRIIGESPRYDLYGVHQGQPGFFDWSRQSSGCLIHTAIICAFHKKGNKHSHREYELKVGVSVRPLFHRLDPFLFLVTLGFCLSNIHHPWSTSVAFQTTIPILPLWNHVFFRSASFLTVILSLPPLLRHYYYYSICPHWRTQLLTIYRTESLVPPPPHPALFYPSLSRAIRTRSDHTPANFLVHYRRVQEKSFSSRPIFPLNGSWTQLVTLNPLLRLS